MRAKKYKNPTFISAENFIYYFGRNHKNFAHKNRPLGVNEGVNIPPRGQISPPGAKFTTRGEVIPWGPGVMLRMALSSVTPRRKLTPTRVKKNSLLGQA
jgi:hypothetical protein